MPLALRGPCDPHPHACLPPLQPILKSVAGDVLDFPKPPHPPVKVPPKEDHTSQVTVPLYLFSTVFSLLQTNGALDIDITPELVSRTPSRPGLVCAGDD